MKLFRESSFWIIVCFLAVASYALVEQVELARMSRELHETQEELQGKRNDLGACQGFMRGDQ